MKVQLLSRRRLEMNGTVKVYEAGQVVELGKQAALAFIQRGIAREVENVTVPESVGVVVPGEAAPRQIGKLEVVTGRLELLHDRSLIWDGKLPLQQERVDTGLKLLDTWQIAAPLYPEILASQIGSEADRELTQAVIHDLRVPVYETGMVFVRRCDDTERLFEAWREEDEKTPGSPLAFLRALYLVKPLILPLPAHWAGKQVQV